VMPSKLLGCQAQVNSTSSAPIRPETYVTDCEAKGTIAYPSLFMVCCSFVPRPARPRVNGRDPRRTGTANPLQSRPKTSPFQLSVSTPPREEECVRLPVPRPINCSEPSSRTPPQWGGGGHTGVQTGRCEVGFTIPQRPMFTTRLVKLNLETTDRPAEGLAVLSHKEERPPLRFRRKGGTCRQRPASTSTGTKPKDSRATMVWNNATTLLEPTPCADLCSIDTPPYHRLGERQEASRLDIPRDGQNGESQTTCARARIAPR
jgi:hypothetical protein